MTEAPHDRRDELAGFEITVTHGPNGDRFKVRIEEAIFGFLIGTGLQDYAFGGAQNFKDALRQALHYVSPALAGEVFPDYYALAAPTATAAINLLMELDDAYPRRRIRRLEDELEASREEVRQLKLAVPRRCKFSSTCEHAHPDDIANHTNGGTW